MADWLERYWVWTASIPMDIHPRSDIDGEHCGINQNGSVWFLDPPIDAEMTKVLNCEIPEGKAIFIPLLVGECDSGDMESASDEELEQCAKSGNDGGTILFSIDGNKILSIDKTSQNQNDYSLYRTTSKFFDIRWSEFNIFGAGNGSHRAIADGYFVVVKPLPPGNHKIDFQIVVISPIETNYNLRMDITYNLKIISAH
jgi:hypothetical protein